MFLFYLLVNMSDKSDLSEVEESDRSKLIKTNTKEKVLFPQSFATYFPRVLRQVHTGLSLSHEALNIMDSFVDDMFERIAEEAGCLTRSSKRCTIMSEDIQTAVCLLLPGEIGSYAMSEATKLVIRYNTHR
ncbi:unnamed protein product [Rangifer tarandus platyrhynchus]|uniref:Core Histone H2A/H2B/H3 domain-containing protein n=1 Tax=Rangifer tarandus platyrhynchus TaxID=3082113 RepID=A0ABN9A682_RANTA|nr:unnamed protein product [Rangifer tarandus platyrhynchus]